MPTSYTSLIGLALPVTGELSGTWGDVVNNYITNYLDSAVAGTQTISGSQTAVTLSVTNGSSLVTAGSGATGSAQFQIINCTGNPAGLLTITAPASSRQYIIINATSTSQSVKIVGTGPTTGVTLIAGEKAHVAWNGSDFVKIATTAAAGGSNTQVQYNSSGVLAGSSNMTFDGTNLTVGGTASATKLIPTGGSATGNGMYLPAANTLAWSNNGSETMRLDSSGNLGLGVTPSTWSQGRAFEVFEKGYGVWNGTGSSYVLANAYFNTNFKYANTGAAASHYYQYQGAHFWSTAASGTAGNAITFTQAMTLDSSGNLGLGVTPSGWGASIKATEAISGGTYAYNVGSTYDFGIYNGCYYDGSNWKYKYSNVSANAYYMTATVAGTRHYWRVAPSSGAGGAGTTVSFTDVMALDASGNFYVGTTSQSGGSNITFNQPANADMKIAASVSTGTRAAYQVFVNTTVTTVGTENSTGGSLATGTSAYATVLANSGAYPISFATNNTERARITSAGVLDLATGAGAVGQIQFPATQVASSNANTLDDYEEGTWTPTVYGASSAGTTTYNQQTGSYTKIGNRVMVDFIVEVTSATGTGNIQVGGLPFTASNTPISIGSGIADYLDLPAGQTMVNPITSENSTVLRLWTTGDNTNWSSVAIDSSFTFIGSVTYRVA